MLMKRSLDITSSFFTSSPCTFVLPIAVPLQHGMEEGEREGHRKGGKEIGIEGERKRRRKWEKEKEEGEGSGRIWRKGREGVKSRRGQE